MSLFSKIETAVYKIDDILKTKDKFWYNHIKFFPNQFNLFLLELESMKVNINTRKLFNPHFIPYIIIDQWPDNFKFELKYFLLDIISDYRHNK